MRVFVGGEGGVGGKGRLVRQAWGGRQGLSGRERKKNTLAQHTLQQRKGGRERVRRLCVCSGKESMQARQNPIPVLSPGPEGKVQICLK